MAKAYPPELREAAITTAAGEGVTAAAKAHGVDKATVSRWCRNAGVATVATERTQAATQAARIRWDQRRVEMAHDLGDLAAEALEVIRANLKDKPRVASDLSRVLCAAIDKAQLLSGDPTSRGEHVHVEPLDLELRRLAADVKARA